MTRERHASDVRFYISSGQNGPDPSRVGEPKSPFWSRSSISMEKLPAEISFKIFCLLDHQNLAKAQQVCKKWKDLASDDILWCNLFKERWGDNHAAFYAPVHAKSWKDVYEVQDRCDRVGLGLKIIREADEYYLIHQGVIQRHLGSRKGRKKVNGRCSANIGLEAEGPLQVEESCIGILDKILFFIGDLEVATRDAKRNRIG